MSQRPSDFWAPHLLNEMCTNLSLIARKITCKQRFAKNFYYYLPTKLMILEGMGEGGVWAGPITLFISLTLITLFNLHKFSMPLLRCLDRQYRDLLN